uniref:Uncharacterized protein n=1 Tax=Anopheles braziliensis TaxID=58242 RepID=A0A2M3ZLU6_9DIPT
MLCLAFAALAMTACLLLLLLLLMWQIRGRLLLLVTSIATTSGHAVHTGVASTSRVMADTRRRLLRHAHNYGSQTPGFGALLSRPPGFTTVSLTFEWLQ